uniref:Mitochondrial translational initiation factor 3 n=1 Tax=Echeneis naucrates TaxID=173247 RepID=A0A665TSH9_ECHNA
VSAGCVRWVLSRALTAVCGLHPACRTPASRLLSHRESSNVIPASWSRCPFSTAADDTERTPTPKKKKQQDARTHATYSNVGHKIPQRLIQLLGETGEDLGTMQRGKVIRMMDEQGLRLVLLNANKDPPVYQLMTGKQIHQEQMKLREKQKVKPATVQVKELVFSSGISSHDLSTKLKQVESWLEKKHHVRITLRSGRKDSAVDLDKALEQMVQQMEVMVGFVATPKVIRDGKAAMCIVRPPSAKELALKRNNAAASQSADSKPKTAQSSTTPVGTTEAEGQSIQQ